MIMPNLALPVNLDFNDWANHIRNDLSMYTIPIAGPKDQWRQWANQVINSNTIPGVPLPTELGYPEDEDWRQWAIRFYQIVQAIP